MFTPKSISCTSSSCECHDEVDTKIWEEEPNPIPRPDLVPIVELVMNDLREKTNAGEVKYGAKLTAYNGRRALRDAYQEALDLTLYLRQVIEEEETNYEGEEFV